MGVGEWLRNLGLGQYEPAFVESAIDFDVLPELTEDDLEKLGMLLGDRKRFIKAIKARAGDSPDALITQRSAGVAERPSRYGRRRTPSLDRDDLRSGGLDCSGEPA